MGREHVGTGSIKTEWSSFVHRCDSMRQGGQWLCGQGGRAGSEVFTLWDRGPVTSPCNGSRDGSRMSRTRDTTSEDP